MRNRIVGSIIIAIAVLMAFIIYSFNRGLTDIVSTSCSHGTSCPMWGTIEFQTNMAAGITAFVALIGLYLVFFGEDERIVTKVLRVHEQVQPNRPSRNDYKDAMKKLAADERKVFERVIASGGDVLQSELIASTGANKVRMTRILDKLESMGLVERRRRGMTNAVVLRR